MINLLMLDLDGTLFDTAQGIANAFNRLLAERGEPAIDRDLIVKNIGQGLRDLLSKLDSKLAHRLGDLQKIETDFHRHYRQNVVTESPLYPGVLEFLKSWPHRLAIVSNKDEFYVRELVEKTELRQFEWATLIGGNSLPQKKPHPLPLHEAIRLAGSSTRAALMVGDGLPDILAARQAQVKSVAISFGYTPLSELIQNGADAVLHSYGDLPKVIHSLTSN
jgi:phosphoglycolate phosphatase